MHNEPRLQTRRRQGNPAMRAAGLLAGCLVLFACLGCVMILGATGFLFYTEQLASHPPPPALNEAEREVADTTLTPTPTPLPIAPVALETVVPSPTVVLSVTLSAPVVTPEAKPVPLLDAPSQIVQAAPLPVMFASLNNLMTATYPAHDYYESAARLGSFNMGERIVPKVPPALGQEREFFVDSGTTRATLVAITTHTYFWVERGLNLDPDDVQQAAERFENEYYPQVVALIGPEWSPGVDDDPHFSVLHLVGEVDATDELGYFSSGDEYPTAFFFDSNEQEIIYLNMSNLTLGEDLYYGTLVHEFQHLAHWHVDPNEAAWMDEGLAQLVELYVGLDTVDVTDYLSAPETQLNGWSYDEQIYAHYGGAFLFMVYLWEQLGDEAVQELARHPANGLQAVNSVLAGFRPELSLQQFFANWAAATLLDDPAAGSVYHYDQLDLTAVRKARTWRGTPFEAVAQLDQFGIHYVGLPVAGETTISFAGDTVTELVPVEPYEGLMMWYVPPIDAVDAQLTRSFDLRDLERATLNFRTWYDLERSHDFAYVSISLDDGATWDLLAPDQARPGDYGPGFTGSSRQDRDADEQGWLSATVSLNSYVGRTVLVRFEVLTSSPAYGRGFALDDIAIPELGFESGAETNDDGWDAAGFVRTGNRLPQAWTLQLVVLSGSVPEVIELPLDAYNQGQWAVDLISGGTLIITPVTPFAPNAAHYWLSIE